VAIPLAYNLRNILVRRITSTLTVIGVGLAIMALAWVLALAQGLEQAMTSAADPSVVILVRTTAISETSSNIEPQVAGGVRDQPEILADSKGRPLLSAELVVNGFLEKTDGQRGGIILRGIGPAGFAIRPRVKVTRGRPFAPGSTEIVVGRALVGRFRGLELGRPYRLTRAHWTVVGVMEAGGGAAESEIWGDSRAFANAFRRDTYSSFVLRLSSPSAFPRLARRVERDSRINLKAWTEEEYCRDQADALAATKHLGLVIALLMGLGAIFGAMNTMYSAVVGRVREIGTLRALGFSSGAIMLSFLVEATLLGLAGGVAGVVLSGLFFHGQDVAITNFRSFAEVQFRMELSPALLGRAFLVAATMGVVGGILPAIRAARLPIVESIREM
jgi:ABC-type lipoprotein release transport system permease subunit